MVTAPVTVSDEPLAPPPTTSQVWIAPVAIGAPMVMAPASAGTEMPLFAEAGERVKVPEVPWLIATAVTPTGLVVNFRLSAVKLPSNVVVMLGPTADVAAKTSVSVATGNAPRSVAPARSLAQFVSAAAFALHEPPATSPFQ